MRIEIFFRLFIFIIMKFKRFMTMMVAAVAIVVGFSSCSSDDDEDEMAVAEQVAGSYTGQEIISVMRPMSPVRREIRWPVLVLSK